MKLIDGNKLILHYGLYRFKIHYGLHSDMNNFASKWTLAAQSSAKSMIFVWFFVLLGYTALYCNLGYCNLGYSTRRRNRDVA